MNRDELKTYIGKKLGEIDAHRDVTEYIKRGKFNFGMVQQQYGHLPSWSHFVRGKKKLVRLIWVQAFFTALMMYAYTNEWEQEWWRVLAKMLIGTVFFTLFINIHAYFSVAFEVNKVQKQVQKLLYEDLLQQLEQKEERQGVNR